MRQKTHTTPRFALPVGDVDPLQGITPGLAGERAPDGFGGIPWLRVRKASKSSLLKTSDTYDNYNVPITPPHVYVNPGDGGLPEGTAEAGGSEGPPTP